MLLKIKQFLYLSAIKILPELFHKIQHYRLHKKFGKHFYWANLNNPQTFNEKILFSKLREEHKNCAVFVDKELVKKYVEKKLGNDVIIPTIGVFHDPLEITVDKLKFPCILKPTHSSSRVLILKNKNEFEEEKVCKIMKNWFSVNHYRTSGEIQYKNLKPKVICEELIQDDDKVLMDYKIFCFDGEPEFIQVDIDRHTSHKRAIYDKEWNKLKFTIKYPLYGGEISKPLNLNLMLEYASVLSKDFRFARIDFYNVNGKIYFGEITFHHESGYGPFTTYEDDLMMGSYYNLVNEKK